MPDSTALAKIRDRIVAHPKKWQAVIEDEGIVKKLGGIQGDGLSRPPRGYDPEHKYIDDLKRKSFFAMKHSTDKKLVTKPEFLDEVVCNFNASVPLMTFISDAVGVEF